MGVALGSAYGEIRIDTAGAQDNVASFASQLKNVGTTLSLGVSAPLLGVATAAIKSAADFEQNMNIMQTVSGATGEQMARMQQQALDLGAQTSFSAGEAAEGMLELSKSGMSVEDTMKTIPGVLDLAAASGLSVAKSAEITSNTLNAFSKEGLSASKIANILSAAADASSLSVGDLAEGVAIAGSAFASNGQKLVTLNAELAILANNGVKGSLGANAVKMSMERLATPTTAGADALKLLGVSVYDANGNMREFPDVLLDIQKALNGTITQTVSYGGATKEQAAKAKHLQGIIQSTTQKLADYKAGIAGVAQSENDKVVAVDRLNRQLVAAQAEYNAMGIAQAGTRTESVKLTQEMRNQLLVDIAGKEALGSFTILVDNAGANYDKMAAAVDRNGAATESANARMKGFSGSIEYLKGSIDSFLIGTALPFLDTLSEYPKMLGDAITGLSNISPALRNAALGFLGVLAVAGPVLLFISGVGTVLGALLSPIGLVILGIAVLAAAWASNFGGIQEKTAAAWAAISPTLTAWKDQLLTALPGALLTLQITAMNAWGAIQTAISGAWGIIQPLLNQLSAWLTENLPLALTTLQTGFTTAMAAIQTVWDALVALFAPSVARLIASFQPMITGLLGLQGSFTGLWAAAQPVLMQLGTGVAVLGSVIGSALAVAGVLAVNLLGSTFQALPTIIGAVVAQMTATLQTISAVVSNMVTLVDALIHGRWAAAFESAKAIVTTLQTFVSTSLNNLWTVISTVFAVIGATIVNTLKDLGFEAAAASIQGVIDKVTSLSEWISGLVKGDIKLGFTEPAWVTSLKAAWSNNPAWAAGLKKTADTIAANPAWIASLKAVTDVIKATPAWLASIKAIVDNWVKETDWVGILKDIVDTWTEAADWIATIQSIVDDWLKSPDWLATLKTQVENWFKVPEWLSTLKTQIEDFFKVPTWVQTFQDVVNSLLGWVPKIPDINPFNAVGASYTAGGGVHINERGRELISIPRDQAILPSGAQIYTNAQSNRILAGAGGGGEITVNQYNTIKNDIDLNRAAYHTASQIRFQAGR